jgi:hypothetical protein
MLPDRNPKMPATRRLHQPANGPEYEVTAGQLYFEAAAAGTELVVVCAGGALVGAGRFSFVRN